MNCQALSTLYIKANGEIPCECDAGERITLGWVEGSSEWSLSETLHGRAYSRMRAAFAQGEAPWGTVCSACSFLRPLEAPGDSLHEHHIIKLQVEPSLGCTLRCPGCSRLVQIRERRPPHVLPCELFEMLLRCCTEEGYSVDCIEYCGQGEPLTHPEFHRLVRLARTILPDAKQRLITNGNFGYPEVMGGERLDEIYVSCDGVFQESYGRYRVNGSVETVFRFMRDATGSRGDRGPLVVWKYILFEFNDSDRELLAAQNKAAELGVDALSFVMTHTEFRSQRFLAEGVEFLPIQTPFTSLDRTPASTGISIPGAPLSIADSRLGRWLTRTTCVVDEARLISGVYLTLRGWAMGSTDDHIAGIRCFVNDQGGRDATLGILRPDIGRTCPEFTDRGTGFFLSSTLSGCSEAMVSVRLQLRTTHGVVEEFTVAFAFAPIVTGRLRSSPLTRLRRLLGRTVCALDEVRLVAGRFLSLTGWALGRRGRAVEHIGVAVDGRGVADATLGLLRPDVLAAFPRISDRAPGFCVLATLTSPPGISTTISLTVRTEGGAVEDIEFRCTLA